MPVSNEGQKDALMNERKRQVSVQRDSDSACKTGEGKSMFTKEITDRAESVAGGKTVILFCPPIERELS
jgi:hypothetical protein